MLCVRKWGLERLEGLLKGTGVLGGRRGFQPSSDSRGGARTLHPKPGSLGNTIHTAGNLLDGYLFISV